MARNIEIKAKVSNHSELVDRAMALSGRDPVVIKQEDVFFNCETGRLKLRILSSEKGELIFYKRNDKSGPKISEYYITATAEPFCLKDILEKCYGAKGIIKKERRLFLAGRTRIHVDQVEGLGSYMELEVVLEKGEDPVHGEKEATSIMMKLGISSDDLVEGAYFDLLYNQNRV